MIGWLCSSLFGNVYLGYSIWHHFCCWEFSGTAVVYSRFKLASKVCHFHWKCQTWFAQTKNGSTPTKDVLLTFACPDPLPARLTNACLCPWDCLLSGIFAPSLDYRPLPDLSPPVPWALLWIIDPCLPWPVVCLPLWLQWTLLLHTVCTWVLPSFLIFPFAAGFFSCCSKLAQIKNTEYH
jgi:hypothetical protein